MATSLSLDEAREFLKTQRTVILSTLDKSGGPISHALWFTYLDDAIYIDIQSESVKARNIRRDARVCCIVEAGESYFELRGVMVRGRCVAVEDPEEEARVDAARAEKNARIGDGMQELPRWFNDNRRSRRDRGSRVLLKVPFEKVTTWNFGQTREHYAKLAAKAAAR
jgi:nitroimidazol reductase NimA-like FMN-containing flavoprotein (pyridoxamine 5'-phosphate oxidase superfamily)